MLFQVRMDVSIPQGLDPQVRAETLAKERAYSQELQRKGKWRHIWRIAGEYANYSVFDVDSNEELHEILFGLPLFPYMRITVTPLLRHPSSIRDDDT
ncbi:muconolactone delta-isomerase [Xanthomonas arboricola pv. juglandis]|uniref:muconolactone Delta-isomerase n=1 Tax=Xanthomonas TaxID=338 RepID=UPI000E5A69A9|nr:MULTISPECIES: muconolactone Delta-isomerase [Xanthomonas]CAD1796225.1 muconolactone Delta-isomerase [Xanthomonas sp. CPBF 426]CAG2095852.1 muconolactone Delta-isomerase [Xanthomonas euroxanthea]SYZ51400.1 muconolactone delta-isomerase [Xanthomonas arboricola pv. juglandis]